MIKDNHVSQSSQTPESTNRYARQIRYPRIGETGQQLLSNSRAAVVGMGALGSVIAQHLVRSGVGYVRIIDRDIIEWSNLQRQMLYTEQDVLQLLPKAVAAANHLRSMNSSVTIEPVTADLTAYNAEELLAEVDLIIDGTDNFSVRYLLNDFSLKHDIPWIYGGAVGASGMTMTILPHETACYRCLFAEPPAPGTTDTCETAGVISMIVDVIASVQSTEALKLLSGNHQALHGTLFQVDLWNHAWMPISVAKSRRNDCPACAKQQYDFLEHSQSEPAAFSLCGRNSVQVSPNRPIIVDLENIYTRLKTTGQAELNNYLIRLQLDDIITFVLFRDGRALIQGTDDLTKARSIYANLLG